MVEISVADAPGGSQGRAERAREIVEKNGAVRRRSLWRNEWAVQSQTGEGGYVVDRVSGEYRCSCRDFELHAHVEGFACKHILAVGLHEAGTMDADEAREWARRWVSGTGFSPAAAAAMFERLPRSLAVRLAREVGHVQAEAECLAGA